MRRKFWKQNNWIIFREVNLQVSSNWDKISQPGLFVRTAAVDTALCVKIDAKRLLFEQLLFAATIVWCRQTMVWRRQTIVCSRQTIVWCRQTKWQRRVEIENGVCLPSKPSFIYGTIDVKRRDKKRGEQKCLLSFSFASYQNFRNNRWETIIRVLCFRGGVARS